MRKSAILLPRFLKLRWRAPDKRGASPLESTE